MKRLHIVMLFVFVLPTLCMAQNNEQAKTQISDVLKNEESYLYADQTCATAEQALKKAQEILNREIAAYLGQDADETEIVQGTISGDVISVTVTRGDKYRAFVYINKSRIPGNSEQPQQETSIPEEPRSQQPQQETSLLEEPQPQQSPQQEQSIPASDTTETKSTQGEPSATNVSVGKTYGALLEPILSMTRKNQIYDYINMLKSDGDDAEWFPQPYALPNFREMYLVLYRRDGSIAAIFSPAGDDGQRTNLKTGQYDSRANYPGTSINGFIIK